MRELMHRFMVIFSVLVTCSVMLFAQKSRVTFFNETGMDFGVGLNGNDGFKSSSYSGFQTHNGIKIADKHAVALGLGLNGFHNRAYNTMPIYLDYIFFTKPFYQLPFFASVNIGTAVKLNTSFESGTNFALGLGKVVALGRIKTNLSCKYLYQQIKKPDPTYVNVNLSALGLHLGIYL